MQTGYINCYFANSNQFSSADKAEIEQIALDKLASGWKVALEYNYRTNYYTLYWGA